MQPQLAQNQTGFASPHLSPSQVFVIDNVDREAEAQLRTFNTKRAKVLGILQIIAGGLCILFNTVAIIIAYNEAWKISAGWWGGPLILTPGVLGVVSAVYPRRVLVNCTLIFSIISSVIFIPITIQCSLAFTENYYFWRNNKEVYFAFNAFFLITGVGELVVSILQTLVCCAATCKCCRTIQKQSLHNQLQSGQPYVYYNNGMPQQQQTPLQSQYQIQQSHGAMQQSAIQQGAIPQSVIQQSAMTQSTIQQGAIQHSAIQQHGMPTEHQSQEVLQQSSYQAGPSVVLTAPITLGSMTPDSRPSYSTTSAAGASSGLAGHSSGLAGHSSRLAGHSSGLAGHSGGLAGHSSGLAGQASGLGGHSSGLTRINVAMAPPGRSDYPENPPPYETNDSNQPVGLISHDPQVNPDPQDHMEQQASMDSKITEWAHREMQLRDDDYYHHL